MSDLDLTVGQSILAPLAARASVIASRKSPLTALKAVLLEATTGALTATSTDTFLGLTERVSAEVKSPGKIAVDAGLFADVVKNMPAGDVSLRIVKGHLEVRSGKSRIKVPVLDHELFPDVPQAGDASLFGAVDARELVRCLAQGAYAMRDLDAMPMLNGTLFESAVDAPKVLSVVSTDSLRLAVATMEAECAPGKLLVPAKAVAELKKLADSHKGYAIEIRSAAGTAFFSTGGVTLNARLIDLPFMPYRKLFPAHTETSTTFDKDSLAGALRRVALVSEETEGGTVNLTFSRGTLRIHGASKDSGDGEDFLDCDASFDVSVRVNPRMLIEAVLSPPDEVVKLGIHGPKGPITVKCESGECTALVMPRDPT